MIDNPFTYGNPISDPAHFIGRERQIEQVFSRLRNRAFESSSLVGERRIGKTSLLKSIAHPNTRIDYGLDPNKYMFVYVDLQLIDEDATPQKFWRHMLHQMTYSCQDNEVKQIIELISQEKSIDSFALDELFDRIDVKKQYVVFLMDEFEIVTANENFNLGFFSGLRSLAIHHHFALVTSSRQDLIELCHSNAIRSSPFFNIFANINIGLFNNNETRQLIHQSLEGTGTQFNETELDELDHLTGGHPHFLQAACHFLFNAYSNSLSPKERCQDLQNKLGVEANSHLAHYWHTSNNHEKIVLTLLTLLQQQKETVGYTSNSGKLEDYYALSDKTVLNLENRSLIRRQQNEPILFSTLLGNWIMREIVDVLNDEDDYKNWLESNQGSLDKLQSRAKDEISEILPKIDSKYRTMIANWARDSRNWMAVLGLLKDVLLRG